MQRKEQVELSKVLLDESVQVRARGTDPQTVSEYSAVLEQEGWVFPDVRLFVDERGYWIGEGFHRVEAAIAAGFAEVQAIVKDGGREDALRCALGSNRAHGLRRTSEDKEYAIGLAFKEFPDLSDRAVAALVEVSVPTVSKYRPEELAHTPRTGLDGKSYPATTAAGKDDEDDESPAEEAAAVPLAGGRWVRADERPVGGELKPHVCVGRCPTWRELAEGSGLEEVERDFGAGAEMALDRDAVKDWCRKPVNAEEIKDHEGHVVGLKPEGGPRWDGFRLKVVALEHAERERERWLQEEKRGEDVVWLRDLLGLVEERMLADEEGRTLVAAFLARQALHHVPVEAVTYAGMARREELQEFRARLEAGDGTLGDVFLLLLGFQLFEGSVENVEVSVVTGLLDWAEGER